MNEENVRLIIKLFSELLKTPEFLGISQLVWTIIIPLLILTLTFLIQWYVKKCINYRRLKLNQEYLCTWSERINKSIKFQMKSYDDIIEKALCSIDTNNYYMQINTIDFDKVYIIKDVEYLELFVQERKGKKETNIENYLNYFHNLKNLSGLFENSKEFYKKWYQSNYDLNKRWGVGIEKFIGIYNQLVPILISNTPDELVQYFGSLMKSADFFSSEKTKVEIKNKLLDPLESFISKYSHECPVDRRIHIFIEAFHLCDSAYREIEQNNELYKSEFERIRKDFEKCNNAIVNAIIVLKNSKIKRNVCIM
ncbi:MAG: hypothetical protein CVU05_06340 [Bacteroidetes bacterium HGW-Bacteroidetes-21]|jgi:hypothetical protein|nr:MAG: hypothetical protein CVU05_06340 [Bacteroidetes bacterium HGW-Bacteroidetes-21]